MFGQLQVSDVIFLEKLQFIFIVDFLCIQFVDLWGFLNDIILVLLQVFGCSYYNGIIVGILIDFKLDGILWIEAGIVNYDIQFWFMEDYVNVSY